MHMYLYINEQSVGDPTHNTQLTYMCCLHHQHIGLAQILSFLSKPLFSPLLK